MEFFIAHANPGEHVECDLIGRVEVLRQTGTHTIVKQPHGAEVKVRDHLVVTAVPEPERARF